MVTPKWQQLVQQIQDDVAAGRLAPGDKLPSFREQKNAGWGETTVKRAYAELKTAGVIAPSSTLGFYVMSRDESSPAEDLDDLRRRLAALERWSREHQAEHGQE